MSYKTIRTFISKFVAFSAVLLLTVSCASVKVSLPSPGKEKIEVSKHSSERDTLIEAVATLESTPWPTPTNKGLRDKMVKVLFGKKSVKADEITEEKALEMYLSELSNSEAPKSILISDADACLQRARNVAEAGRQAATAIVPSDDDIGVLETAISSVRQNRDIYVSAMKELLSDGHGVEKVDIKEVNSAFSQTINDIGRTADLLSDRVAARKGNVQYALPALDDDM